MVYNAFIIFTASLILYKSRRVVYNSQIFNLSALFLEIAKTTWHIINSSISNLSTFDFKLPTPDFLGKFEVSIPVHGAK